MLQLGGGTQKHTLLHVQVNLRNHSSIGQVVCKEEKEDVKQFEKRAIFFLWPDSRLTRQSSRRIFIPLFPFLFLSNMISSTQQSSIPPPIFDWERRNETLHLLCADLRTMQFSNAIRERRRGRRRRRSREEREDAGKKTCLNDPGVLTMLMTLTWMPLHYYDNNYFLLVESSIWEWFEVKWVWGDKREKRKGKIGRRRELDTNLQLGPTGKVMQFWKKDQQVVLS